ncbi:MAG: 2OG-Fe(II) oxygenase, partial [Thiohalomonadales bacterium]
IILKNLSDIINPLDVKELHKHASNSPSFPYFFVDNFLKEEFANEVHDSFPDYDKAITIGKTFNAVNEVKKVQVTDFKLFPSPIAKLNKFLASKEFINKIESILDLTELSADKNLMGGGIHETREGGRLDVHVDFNFNKEIGLYRRANILIYFNKDWKKEYGGILDLWDSEVKKCHAEILPIFNRMVCFSTSEISYHGVTPLRCPKNKVRKSFAAYYYSTEASDGYAGSNHSTIFKARPEEWMLSHVSMPVHNIKVKVRTYTRIFKNVIKNILKK